VIGLMHRLILWLTELAQRIETHTARNERARLIRTEADLARRMREQQR
jgi:hypothetical protein